MSSALQRLGKHRPRPGPRRRPDLRLCRAVAISAAVSGALLATPPAPAEEAVSDPTAREIMELVDARDDGDYATQDMRMILIDGDGNRRVREIRSMRRDEGDDRYSLLFFRTPADLKNTGLLTYDYHGDKDDDQWIYLPALKRIKRIAGADKSGSFMGSDFSYADMTKRPIEKYEYTLMKETEVHGEPAWQIQAVPVDEDEVEQTGYTKSIVFVRQDNYVVIRSVSWLKNSSRLKYFDVKSLEKIDGIWIPTEMHMTTRRGRAALHKTIISASNIRLNHEVPDDMFSVRRLEKGL